MRNIFSKAGAAIGVAALATASASPAAAQYRDNNGIGTAEVIAGAVVLAGIVALIASDDDDDDRYDKRYYGNDYRYGDSRYGDYRYNRNASYNRGRAAIEQCVYATERYARRYGYADVTEIRDVKRNRNGYRVKGRVEIRQNNRWGRNNRDRANFNCIVDRGRVVDVNINGLGRYR